MPAARHARETATRAVPRNGVRDGIGSSDQSVFTRDAGRAGIARHDPMFPHPQRLS